MLRERYGVSADRLLAARARANRSILGYIGLRALRDGDRKMAREAFRRAMQTNPRRVKSILRYLKTYLPLRIARALSGRTRLEQ
jgi:hypothetical protein